MNTSFSEHTFPALQASSLLGFMAALGTFRTLASKTEYSTSRMKWIPLGSSYCPVLRVPAEISSDALLEELHAELRSLAGHRVFTFEQDLKVTQMVFRNLASDMAEAFLNDKDTFGCKMVAAYGCDGVINEEKMIEDTAFRTMSGAGHQHFLTFMNDLAKQTTLDHLREALYGPWQYRDPSPVMRWDNEDDRRYALRWDEPSKDPVRTVRGANRLAIASLTLFATVPLPRASLATTGFKGNKSNNTFVTWPIWNSWLSIDSVQSALALNELQETQPPHSELAARGVSAIFRCQRITLGKYRNFTPSRGL